MRGRNPVGYVVQVEGANVFVNLLDSTRGLVAGHVEGVSGMEQPGDVVGIKAGAHIIALRISSIFFKEPREAHQNTHRASVSAEPLRQMSGHVLGFLTRNVNSVLEFKPYDWRLPPLGASVFPLSNEEHRCILNPSRSGWEIRFGYDVRKLGVPVNVGVNEFLGRHAAILGSTGQGKTHFVASILQKLVAAPNARIIVFDVNGEYSEAFSHLGDRVRKTVIGADGDHSYKIPYYALGRHGLFRLLMPSERTQSPALRFALEHLSQVESYGEGANIPGGAIGALRDDCAPGSAQEAHDQISRLRGGGVPNAAEWPHMQAISCLVADSYAIRLQRQNWERDAFAFSHLQSLINRIRSLIDDERFRAVVDVEGGPPVSQPPVMDHEASSLVSRIFGPQGFDADSWQVHVVDVSRIAQDIMPFVLGSLLEMLASEIFRRGPGNSFPTLLALEEAHHYLRQAFTDSDGGNGPLAYERLAKEGRKFGLSLLISTQRPSEVSPTVLAQCGTWCVFRLNNEADQRAVASASETAGPGLVRQLPGLGRGEAYIFGNALPVATRVNVDRPDPEPRSGDPMFESAWTGNHSST